MAYVALNRHAPCTTSEPFHVHPRPSQLRHHPLWNELRPLYLSTPNSPQILPLIHAIIARARLGLAAGDSQSRLSLCDALSLLSQYSLKERRADDAVHALNEEIALRTEALALAPTNQNVRVSLAHCHYSLGTHYADEARPFDAVAVLEQAIVHAEACVREVPGDASLRNLLAQSHFNQGNVVRDLKRPDEALKHFRTARDLWRALCAEDPSRVEYAHDLARSEFNQALILDEYDRSESVSAFMRARDGWHALIEREPNHAGARFDLARCSHVVAEWFFEMGRDDDALDMIDVAVNHYDLLITRFPSETMFVRGREHSVGYREFLVSNAPEPRLARILAESEHHASEAREARNTVAIHRIALALLRETPHFVRAQRPVELERLYRAAIELVDAGTAFGDDGRCAFLGAASYTDLMIDLAGLNRCDRAEVMLRCAVLRWRRLETGDPRARGWLAGLENQFGLLCDRSGRLDVADAAYRKAIAQRESLARDRPHETENLLYLAGALCNLGNVHRDRGLVVQAQGLY
jgi:tetratricopeptide (TPR) repeat protein